MKKIIIRLTALMVLVMSLITVVDMVILGKESDEVVNKIVENEFLLSSSLFTQVDEETLYNQPTDINFDGFEEAISNDKLIMYTNKTNGAIRIKNKTTNFVWCSDVYDETTLGDSVYFKKRATAGFALTYRNTKSVSKEVLANETTLVETVGASKVHYDVTVSSAGISFSYDLTITDNKLNVLLDYQSITEGENKLISIRFFPYMGSVYKTTIPSYLFIPTGNGALVRFDREPSIAMMYTMSFYGSDANLSTSETEVLSLPIYGIVQGTNQNGVLVEVKEGAEFAKFNYSPSSINQSFNLAYVDFNLRETYSMKLANESILMIPDNYYEQNIELEYTFLDGDFANYVGFAQSYQDDLIKRGIISLTNSSKTDIDLQIDAFGRDYEKGLIFKEYYNMTTTKDIIMINDSLIEQGVKNIFYSLRAFNKNGYSAQSSKNIKFDKHLGSMSDLDDLEAYYYYNPIESYNSKKSYPANTLINMFNEKNYYKISDSKYKFYSNSKIVTTYTKKAIEKYSSIAIDGLGYRLYGDKNNKNTRYEVKEMFVSTLGEVKVPMYTPNYYFLANTSKYLNMPLYHDRLRFVTDSVPFTQILLKGYIDYYSPYLNFSSNYKLDSLKCIEYGVYPAYLITEKQSYLLADTLSSNYYATYYDTIKGIIANEYKEINKALNQVINAKIVNRKVLTSGVYEVTYSNGKVIVCNYTSGTYSYKGNSVSSMGYVVI